MRHSALVCILIASCGVFPSRPTAAAGQDAGPPLDRAKAGALVADVRHAAIRSVYDRVAGLTRGTAEPLVFQIRDDRDFRSDELDGVPLTAVLSPPEGDVIDVEPVSEGADDRPGSRRHYAARWTAAAAEQAARTATLVEAGTLADLLKTLPATGTDAAALGVRGATSYRVNASFGGRAITYRAVAFWRGPDSGSATTRLSGESVVIVDHFTRNLDRLAGVIDLPPSGAPAETSATTSSAPFPPGPECVPANSRQPWYPTALFGREEHTTGSHFLQPSYTFVCSCDASCNASCTSEIDSFCRDDGSDLPFYTGHVYATAPARDGRGEAYPQSLQRGAVCGAASGCAVKSCYFGNCSFGVSIGVSVTGSIYVVGVGFTPAVTWSPPSDAIWNAKDSYGWPCPPCQIKKKKVRRTCRCPVRPSLQQSAAAFEVPPGCTVEDTCEDAMDGEGGYDTCDEALNHASEPTACCGDGTCGGGESCSDCPEDCGTCGGGSYCGDGICAGSLGENQQNCCQDCGCPSNCMDCYGTSCQDNGLCGGGPPCGPRNCPQGSFCCNDEWGGCCMYGAACCDFGGPACCFGFEASGAQSLETDPPTTPRLGIPAKPQPPSIDQDLQKKEDRSHE